MIHMPYRSNLVTVLMFALLAAPAMAGEPVGEPEESPPEPQAAFSWPEFMSRHDLVWSNLRKGYDAGFMGNGSVGAEVLSTNAGKSLVWRLGRQDAYAIRVSRGRDGKERGRGFKRHGIGDLVLQLQGDVVEGDMRQRLWDATIEANIKTTAGAVSMRTFTHAELDLIIIDLQATGDERQAALTFQPIDGVSKTRKDGDLNVCIQPYEVQGDRSVVWLDKRADVGHRRIYLSIGASPDGASVESPRKTVQQAAGTKAQELEESHQRWWHAYYQRHFFSIPETKLESLYWIGIYRLGSMFHPDGTISDNSGIWSGDSVRWRHITCDMNIQCHYPALYPANLVDHAKPLVRTIDNNLHYLSANMGSPDPLVIGIGRRGTLDLLDPGQVSDLKLPRRTIDDIADDLQVTPLDPELRRKFSPGGEALTNFGWMLHNYYQHYRMTMDERTGRNLYKLMKLNMRGYLYMLGEKAEDGHYHLAGMYSPECGLYDQPDANYGLSMIRWECRTLLELADHLEIEDPDRAAWEDILKNLVPYPADENGYLVYPGHPTKNHRHWSHLLMIHPLREVNWDQAENREMIRKSVDFWVGKGMQGRPWSIAAAGSMYASMGDAAAAGQMLQQADWKLGSNTSWGAGGGILNETPLLFVKTMQDCVLQSWGGVIRVFPAVPKAWGDVTIHDMRAEGAFSVSAMRQSGRTRWVYITSHAGEPCRVRTDLPHPIEAAGGRALTVKKVDENTVELDLRKGESVLLHTQGDTPELRIKPAPDDAWTNWWGDRRKKP